MAKKTNKTEKKTPKKAVKVVTQKSPTKGVKKLNAAFMAALTPSPALAAIIGDKPIPRTEIIKKIWEYIRKNGLQDQVNKRMINADPKLKVIFEQKDQISMFELAKVVNNNVKKME